MQGALWATECGMRNDPDPIPHSAFRTLDQPPARPSGITEVSVAAWLPAEGGASGRRFHREFSMTQPNTQPRDDLNLKHFRQLLAREKARLESELRDIE